MNQSSSQYSSQLPVERIQAKAAAQSVTELRALQTKLTKAVNVLANLTNPLGTFSAVFTPTQQAMLNQSSELIKSLHQSLEEAKVKRIQSWSSIENSKQIDETRNSLAWTVASDYFYPIQNTADRQLHVFYVAICLNQLGLYQAAKSPSVFRANLLDTATSVTRNFSANYMVDELLDACQTAVHRHITENRDNDVQSNMDELDLLITDLLEHVRQGEPHLMAQLAALLQPPASSQGGC